MPLDFDIGKLLGLDKLEKVVARVDRPRVVLDKELCLRARGGLSKACAKCVAICPARAIEALPTAVDLNAERCVECGICVGVCPAGAFSGRVTDDFIVARAREAAGKTGHVVYTCRRSDFGGGGGVDVKCLGRLNISHLIAAVATGAKAIYLDDRFCHPRDTSCDSRESGNPEVCSDCDWASGLPDLAAMAAGANELLGALGSEAKVVTGVPAVPAMPDSPRESTGSEVGMFSRRDFFVKVRRQAAAAGAEVLAGKLGGLVTGEEALFKYKLPRSRELLLAAAKKLAPDAAGLLDTSGLPLGRILIDENCIFCRNCTMFCPTGALAMRGDVEEGGGIDFCLASCTRCGLCETVCPTKSVSFADRFDMSLLLEYKRRPVIEYKSYKCKSCGQKFGSVTEAEKCGFCKLRETKLADDF